MSMSFSATLIHYRALSHFTSLSLVREDSGFLKVFFMLSSDFSDSFYVITQITAADKDQDYTVPALIKKIKFKRFDSRF